MSRATFTFGRFNAPTEGGHGKLVSAVQAHAEKTGGSHYIFPSHSQDKKKNPLPHDQKVGFMRRLFPNANVVSHDKVRTAIDAMKHLEKKGHTHVTMVVGSDRVDEFHGLLNKYRKKEYPGIKKVNVVSAGHRDPDAEGAEGESASKHRALVAAGKRKEFISKYSDPKLGAEIHDAIKKGMTMESANPIGIFLLGGPGSGKDYVLKNVFSRFDLMEVQVDHILNGAAQELIESNQNIVINGALDEEKISVVKQILEGYDFDHVYVSVTNKVSQTRNAVRENPLNENKRLEKWYRTDKLAKSLEESFEFKNSLDLNSASELEKIFFANQIEKLLERIINHGLVMNENSNPKTFAVIREAESKYIRRVPRSGGITTIEKKRAESRKDTLSAPQLEEKKFPAVPKDKESGLPKKYVAGLSASTAKARKAHWKKMSKYSDKDPRAYEPAPGDATAKTKPSKHTLAVRKMMGEQVKADVMPPHSVEEIAKKHKVDVEVILKALDAGKKVEKEHTKDEKTAEIIALGHLWERPDYYKMLAKAEKVTESADSSLSAKAKKSGISLGTLRKVYKRGVAAWNSGHRPGTTPQQWGHARVNSYINKGKTYHTADKDLREETKITGSNCKNCIHWIKESEKPVDKSELNENGGLIPPNKAYVAMAKHADLITLPGKATVSVKAYCNHEDIHDFVTERMCCAYWDNKEAKRPFKGKADVMEDIDIDILFERQLEGTDEYRKHAIAMTPGQKQEIDDAFENLGKDKGSVVGSIKEGSCGCGGDCGCDGNCGANCSCNETIAEDRNGISRNPRKFSEFRNISEAKKENDGVDFTPTVSTTTKKKNPSIVPARNYRSTLDGMPVASRFSGTNEEKKKGFMPTPRQVPAIVPPGTKMVDGIPQHNVPKGFKRVRDNIAGFKLVKEEGEVTLEEAIQYHLENKISFTENVFRPGSEMFFEMISEAKRLYSEGKYEPKDEWEADMLQTDIGEKAIYEGQEVILDYPFEEELNEEDKTDGKGIGKPWREGGGGAVYVRDGGSIRKIRFSQSGMKKKYMDPAATRSFVARHRCLTNKDKTSASYWACRWPRFFSNSGKVWW